MTPKVEKRHRSCRRAGQRLGVRLSENDGQMLCGGTLLAAIKQSAYVVG
jgi:hypothetical protein